jgi:hypothetical protein
MSEGLEGAVERPEGTDEQELVGHDTLDEYANGELERNDDDDQEFLCVREDETDNSLGDGGDEEDPYALEDGNDEDAYCSWKDFLTRQQRRGWWYSRKVFVARQQR